MYGCRIGGILTAVRNCQALSNVTGAQFRYGSVTP
jgi:hypothetical protein